jgi:plastocyanin
MPAARSVPANSAAPARPARRHALRAALAILAGASGAGTAFARARPGATLRVLVTDKDGKPAPDTAVLLRYVVRPSEQPPQPASVVIDQERMQFRPFLTVVTPGTRVQFTNRDGFDHHVRANHGLDDAFELRLAPGATAERRLGTPGRYALGCHLHSAMRGYVIVTDTPWFGITDAQGELVLSELPTGLIDLVPMHPEQFSEQAPRRLVLTDTETRQALQLDFTPRRRRRL